jgi:hypothetical protein
MAGSPITALGSVMLLKVRQSQKRDVCVSYASVVSWIACVRCWHSRHSFNWPDLILFSLRRLLYVKQTFIISPASFKTLSFLQICPKVCIYRISLGQPALIRCKCCRGSQHTGCHGDSSTRRTGNSGSRWYRSLATNSVFLFQNLASGQYSNIRAFHWGVCGPFTATNMEQRSTISQKKRKIHITQSLKPFHNKLSHMH